MLESNIKPKPEFLKKFPWRNLPLFEKLSDEQVSFTFYPNIYLIEDLYNDLKLENPDTKTLAYLIHEQTHLKRQGDAGRYLWLFRYLTSGKFRFNEELEAVKAEFGFMKKQGYKYNINLLAKVYSGTQYYNPVTFEYAKIQFEKAYEAA